jgi:hypothetical protein
MAHAYVVHAKESDGSTRSFDYIQGDPLKPGDAIVDQQRDLTYIVTVVVNSPGRRGGEVDAEFVYGAPLGPQPASAS